MLVPVGSDNVGEQLWEKRSQNGKYQLSGQDINANTVANEKYKYNYKST